MLGWWSQPASFSSPAIKLNPPWSPHQSRWLLLASEKGWWHERRDGIEKGVGAIDNGCLFISQNRMATKEQRTISGCYASLICFWVFLALAVDNHWWRLLLQSIKSDKCWQLWKTCLLLFFFQTDEILLKKSKKIWHVKPTFCTDPLNLFTFLSLSDPSRRSKSVAADASKCLKAKAAWLCEHGRLGRQRSHSRQETSEKHCILSIHQFIS